MKPKNFPKKPDAFLDSKERDLRFVLQKVQHLKTINAFVQPLLDQSYAHKCQVANIEGSKLSISVPNSSIATQCHFQAPELLKQFKKHPTLANIKQVQFKVNKELSTRLTQTHSRKVKTFTDDTATLIEMLAEGIEDTELQIIMKRIAKSGKA